MLLLLLYIPILFIWCNLAWGIIHNVTNKLLFPSTGVQLNADSLLTSELAFNWAQFAISSVMFVMLSICMIKLFFFTKSVCEQRYTQWNFTLFITILLLLMFSLPAAWEFFWFIIDSIMRKEVLIEGHWFDVVTALCLPYLFVLIIILAIRNTLLKKLCTTNTIQTR